VGLLAIMPVLMITRDKIEEVTGTVPHPVAAPKENAQTSSKPSPPSRRDHQWAGIRNPSHGLPPAIRGAAIEPRESTQLRHWPRGFGASAT
jgi:hypothetical protein